MLDFAKETIESPKVVKYYNEPDSPISLIFTDKITIDWEKLRTSIECDSIGYITH